MSLSLGYVHLSDVSSAWTYALSKNLTVRVDCYVRSDLLRAHTMHFQRVDRGAFSVRSLGQPGSSSFILLSHTFEDKSRALDSAQLHGRVDTRGIEDSVDQDVLVSRN